MFEILKNIIVFLCKMRYNDIVFYMKGGLNMNFMIEDMLNGTINGISKELLDQKIKEVIEFQERTSLDKRTVKK